MASTVERIPFSPSNPLRKATINREQVLEHLGWMVILAFIVYGGWIAIRAGGQQTRDFLTNSSNQVPFLTIYVTALFFPLSAFAYLTWKRENRVKKLGLAFHLLGIDKFDRSSENDSDRYRYAEQYAKKRERSTNHPLDFAFQSILTTLFVILGLSLFFWTYGPSPIQEDAPLMVSFEALQAMRFGFIGAYLFSLHHVYRRYTTNDLQPIVYTHCTLTLIGGLIFNYVAFEAISSVSNDPATTEVTGLSGGILAIVAFSFGYFPYLAIRWFNRVAYNALGANRRRANELPLDYIDGISEFHEARLRDEGIDNLQNLASVKIDEILLTTPFSTQEVIEWIDQAILYMYLEPSEIVSFRRGGIRTFTDLRDRWDELFVEDEILKAEIRGQESDEIKRRRELREQRANHFQSTPTRLDSLYSATRYGTNVAYIENYWKHIRESVQSEQQSRLQLGEKIAEAADKGDIKPIRTLAGEIQSDAAWQEADKSDASFWADDSIWGIQSEDANTLLLKSQLATREDKDDVALEALQKALTLEPENTEVLNSLALLVATEFKEYESAKTYAMDAVEISQSRDDFPNPHYLDTLAVAEIGLGELHEGAEHAIEAIYHPHNINRNPGYPSYINTMVSAAKAYFARGDNRTASGILEWIKRLKHRFSAKMLKTVDQLLNEIHEPLREETIPLLEKALNVSDTAFKISELRGRSENVFNAWLVYRRTPHQDKKEELENLINDLESDIKSRAT